jgi:glucuronokinase
MDRQGFGNYERLDPSLLPPLYVAYRTSLSEGTEVFHNNVRARWMDGDPEVAEAMRTWAAYADEGRKALLNRDYDTLYRLINANFDLRSRLYRIDDGNMQMIQTARRVGASSNFAGSGGAIVGTYRDEKMFLELTAAMQAVGVAVVKPRVSE